MTKSNNQTLRDYHRIEQAISFLHENFRNQPSLNQIAQAANLSPHHFQRLFARWAGVSPKRFMQALSIEEAKNSLRRSESVLDASLEAGLSGPGRLHDLFVNFEAMTPGEFKTNGEGLVVHYGSHIGPYGEFVIAITKRGVCGLQFFENGKPDAALTAIRSSMPGAKFDHAPDKTRPYADTVFNGNQTNTALRISVVGTNFQVKVWHALLSIPSGDLVSYGKIANLVGQSGAARAVGSAVGANPVAHIIPCHRAIRATGLLDTNYRWGTPRKLAMIGREAVLSREPIPS